MSPLQKRNVCLADLDLQVGANTGNTAFVVGEKAADIFIKELGAGKELPARVQGNY